MAPHTTALVSLESWAYQSPELRAVGKQVDVGLLAESLVYYDTVLCDVGNQIQLGELLRWLVAQRALDDFLAMVRDGEVLLYDYSFVSAPILVDGVYVLMNMEDETEAKPNSFEQRFLYHPAVASVLPKARQREKLYRVFRDHVIEAKAVEFGASINNARADHLDPRRTALVVQYLVDEVYAFRGLANAPRVIARIEPVSDTKPR